MAHDLSEFDELNQRKAPWPERVEVIKRHFPSVASLDWKKVFYEDPTIAGRLINDILKIGEAQPGKPGKRPSLAPDLSLTAKAEVYRKIRTLTGTEYATEPFPEAFRALTHSRSVRALAAKTGLDRNMIQKIRKGYTPPIRVIEQIAFAFKKQPEYFVEYRTNYVAGFVYEHLAANPDASMLFVKKVKDQANGSS